MTKQEDTRRKSRRDLLLILLILPFGVLCMFMTGQSAIKLAPTWMLPVNMFSNLDPNAEFAGLDNPLFIEPLNPGILTQPVWDPLFLTPEAIIPTREVVAVSSPPPPVRTPQPPPVEVNTPDNNPAPTATLPGGVILPTQSIPLLADLAITKTDSNNTYTPGTAINYTIVVTNQGPDEAYRFNVVDNIPAVISGLTVNCTPVARCGTNTSSGNTVSFINASLITGNQLTITVDGLVASGAIGNLPNTAEVIVPPGAGYRDIFEASNIATDIDTQLSNYDLAITKSDGLDTYTAATTQFNYTIVVTNSGPSDAINIGIRDNLPPQITSWSWNCITANPTCNGVTNSTSNFSDTVTIQSGSSIQYAVTALLATITPPQNPQNISNTASLVIPSGPGVIVEQNPANNSATDTNTPYIDLQITKDDGVPTYTPGGTLQYIVTVTNTSSFGLTGVAVTDNIPTLITSWTWICTPDPGPPSATCTASGTSNINDLVDLPAGASVTYTINATVNGFAAGTLENTASVSPPSGLVDAVPGDNTATDSDINFFGEPEIGPPDGNQIDIPEGGVETFLLSQPVVANGDGAADFVFYEFPAAPGIALDNVIVEISTDGSAWLPVFYWGDGIADTNTNVNINLPNIASACVPPSTEQDNCQISSSDLYNNTGITIDVDNSPLSVVPGGSYYWIRFTAPAGSGDPAQLDAIQILP